MPNKNTNTTLLILTVLLCLVVVGLGAYTYSFYNEVKKNQNQLVKDKELIQAELSEEINRYGKLLEEKNQLSSQLILAKERLEDLQKKLDSNEITRSVVQQYQIELRQLRKEREFLFKQNDSLQQETRRLSDLQEKTQNSLDSITKERSLALVDRSKDSIATTYSPQITISNLQAQGVIRRNSGKFATTSRAGRAQMVRLCYQVNPNLEITESQLTFFVRMFDNDQRLIGIERSVVLESGDKLSYNVETSIQYKNELYRICELILPIRPFSKGDYEIEIYNKYGLLETINLTLK